MIEDFDDKFDHVNLKWLTYIILERVAYQNSHLKTSMKGIHHMNFREACVTNYIGM